MFLIVLLVFYTPYISAQLIKCCDPDSYLSKHNSTYICQKDTDKRVQIFTKETNALQTTPEGTCFDGPNITQYTISNYSIVNEKPISVNFYPKCCPLSHFYHTETHSCVYSENTDDSFIKQYYVKVGLPNCEVIVDYKLVPGNYREEIGHLYLEANERKIFGEGEFCIDKDENEELIARGCGALSACQQTKCLRKCCPDGQSFVGGKKCLNTFTHGLDLNFTDRVNNSGPFAIVHGLNCRVYIAKDSVQFNVDEVGTFHVFSNLTNSFISYPVDSESYCIEHVHTGQIDSFKFLLCLQDAPLEMKFVVTRWIKIISCIFIVLTVIVYGFLPEMLNLFGKILISYCMATLSLFLFLIYVQFNSDPPKEVCVATSFAESYSSLASFCWLNIMCFDIWQTFGKPKTIRTSRRSKGNLKRFFFYSLYGWGLPALITLITYLAYGVFELPYSVKPFLGEFKCFWEKRTGNYGFLIFYVVPLILIEIANLVLFIRTITYCLKVKAEIKRMNDNRISVNEKTKTYNLDREQLYLILKLGVVMGVSFFFEVVSSTFSFSGNKTTEIIETIWDTINCLQGVFIFVIFICKRKIYQQCRNRLLTAKNRKFSSFSETTTQVTELLHSKPK